MINWIYVDNSSHESCMTKHINIWLTDKGSCHLLFHFILTSHLGCITHTTIHNPMHCEFTEHYSINRISRLNDTLIVWYLNGIWNLVSNSSLTLNLINIPHYLPFERRIHRSSMVSPHKKPATRIFDFLFMVSLTNFELFKIPVSGALRRHDAYITSR